MHELRLYRPERGGSEHLHGVVDDWAKIKAQGVKVYRTHVKNMVSANFVLTTTSKDIHLALGAMSFEGQRHLCLLLDEQFRKEKCAELLLFEPNDHRNGVLVALVQGPDTTFNLSPAR